MVTKGRRVTRRKKLVEWVIRRLGIDEHIKIGYVRSKMRGESVFALLDPT